MIHDDHTTFPISQATAGHRVIYTLAADLHGSRRVLTTSSHSPWTSCSLSQPPDWSLLLMLYQTEAGLLSCPRQILPV